MISSTSAVRKTFRIASEFYSYNRDEIILYLNKIRYLQQENSNFAKKFP